MYRLELIDKVPNEHTTVAGLSLECYAASLSFDALANMARSLFDTYCSIRYARLSSTASASASAPAPPREGLLALTDAHSSHAVDCNAENESSTDSPTLSLKAHVEPNAALFLVMYRAMHTHLLKCIALLFNSEYARVLV